MNKDEYTALIRKASYAARLHKYHIITTFHGHRIYRGQPQLLKYLSEHVNCSQRDVAASFHISPASVAVSIKRLCKAGLAEKSTDSADARVNRLSLTDEGRKALNDCEKVFEETDRKTFEGVSVEEIGVFSAVLDKMISNLGGNSIDESKIFELLSKERNGERG